MAEKELTREDLQLDDSVKKNKKGEAILGKLYGPCADFLLPTRNGRGYSEELWEKVFNDPLINEYFKAGGILGELNHPTDRSETDLEKVAVCMPEKPKKDKNGHLVATFDILDTPNGRITYTLAKYGYKLGVSSRGDGDVYEDYNGNDQVDPSTYQLNAFDIVLLPAVKAARLDLVESLDRKKLFKTALTESLDKSTPEERAIMESTLKELNIDYNSEKDNNIEVVSDEKTFAAHDVGADVINDLQESLKRESALKEEIKELHEKLSVCYTKEAKKDEEIQRYKSSVITLSESARQAKELKAQVQELTEKVEAKQKLLTISSGRVKSLTESQERARQGNVHLTESLKAKDEEIANAKKQIKSLQEQLNRAMNDSDKEKQSLTESIETLKKNSAIKGKEYADKLAKSNNLVEHYKQIATAAVNKYIDTKAMMIGVTPAEIKNKLNEDYSFDDIDAVCEDLQTYQLNVNRLPFDVVRAPGAKVRVTESKKDVFAPKTGADDEVDAQLLNLMKNYYT